jgi:signal transduction histidine kinase
VLLLALVAFGVPLALSLRDRVDAEVRGQARSQADVVAASSTELLAPRNRRSLERLVESSAESVRGRVIVVDANGLVLADSAGGAEVGLSYADRPEITAALSGRSFQAERRSDTLGINLLATAVPVLKRGAPVGAVRVTQSVEAVNHAVHRSLAGIAVLALAVLVLGLIAGALIARRIARPIDRLAETAEQVAGGDLSATAPVEGSSEQRSLARTFNGMTNRVGRLLASQREFVADASHQLRTPLTGLRLQLEEIQHSDLDADGRVAADAAIHEVDRLALIVRELLVLSRAGEHELPAERLDLGELGDRAAVRWAKAAEAKGVRLRRESVGPGAEAEGATSDLDRALDALIENAIAYSPPGTEITVSDDAGGIEIVDSGPGLEPGEEDAVLERFYRGRAGRQGPEGTGLGLPIARELAAQWGGSVTLSNRAGGGACARVDLPTQPLDAGVRGT